MNEIQQIVETLEEASELYYNDGESFLTDQEFDELERKLKELDPGNLYFLGVGAEERGEKVPLPVTMGSLDQLYENEVQNWFDKENLTGAKITATEKLDGTSVLVVYGNSGDLQIAFSRGNGREGADITRHLKKIQNVPKKISQPLMIRAEAILPKASWSKVQTEMASETGRVYKNARNWGAGQMNKKQAAETFYENQHIVAYEIIKPEGLSKNQQLEILKKEGFLVANSWEITAGQSTEKTLKQKIQWLRDQGAYEIDGVVIDVTDAAKRRTMKSRESSLNPGFARKYKVGCENNVAITKVKRVHWNASKHGYLKPRVEIEPVDLVGVTITFATGFNAKFIRDNGVGPGAEIQIVRSGDVIPFIQKVLKPGAPELPGPEFGELRWTENEVDIVMVDESDDVKFQKLKYFFEKLEVSHAGEGNLQKVFDAGNETAEQCVKLSRKTWQSLVGESAGGKIFDSLAKQLNPVKIETLAAASGIFERGLGERKLRLLVGADGLWDLKKVSSISAISEVDGFSTITAEKVLGGLPQFGDFMAEIDEYFTLLEPVQKPAGGEFSGIYAVLTGIRDQELQDAIEAKGGEVGSSMSKITVLIAKDPMSNSGKAKKAREKGVEIISLAEARARYL